MYKRFLSLFLCLLLLTVCVLPAAADTVAAEEAPAAVQLTIGTAEEFLTFAESCRLDSFSIGMEVALTADIDLSSIDFRGIPTFSGTFDGGGHTVSGLNITADGSYLGLFRYLTATALVQNLNVEGNIAPDGSRAYIGGIAGSNAGTIQNCVFSGSVSGGDNVGGLVGINTMTGIIETCTVRGNVGGSHFVGGISGSNSGVIRSCVNHALINTTVQQNSVEISDITMSNLTNSESVGTVTDIGGIAGSSAGVIRDCENRGDVGYKLIGYNIGGIAGTQSGYITGCTNYASVSGRKEVGGIVGQMEPMATIEYDEDALQLLEEQLDSMSQIINQTAANMRGSASEITSQVEAIQGSIQDAQNAISALIPDEEDPTLPDADALQNAQNALSQSMTTMQKELQSINATSNSAMGTLSNNLYALQNQIESMNATVSDMSENLGGSLRDVSDLDTEEDLSGKVSLCQNYGDVLADMNVGGIVGAISMENDLDPEEDVDILGSTSLNFESSLRAVILSCSNTATVTAKKQNAGGIAGWISLGLIKNCANTGAVEAEGADNVGGITGLSTGYLRANSANCIITGDTCVGGITGSGTIVTDCRSMVLLTATEQVGGLIGQTQTPYSEEENPIAGNYYLCIDSDPGGIDGINYAGQAERLEKNDFLALDGLSQIFRAVTITFHFEDGEERSYVTLPGSDLQSITIPELPQKEGYTALWSGLQEVQEMPLYFDMSFDAAYIPLESTLQSSETTENGMPLLLLTGSFGPDSVVTLSQSVASPTIDKGMTLLEAFTISAPESESEINARYLLPEDADTENLRLLMQHEGNVWTETAFTVVGSYAVFSVLSGKNTIALMQEEASLLPTIAIVAAVLAAAVLMILLMRKKRARK